MNVAYVYSNWLRMGLRPENAYLFVPGISAIPTHFGELVQGRYVDLWLLWVYQQFGLGLFLLTLAVSLLLLAASLVLLGVAHGARLSVHIGHPGGSLHVPD